MIGEWALGLGLGGGLGLLYGLASFLTSRYAARRSQRTFMWLVFGGMIARMAVAFLLLVLVLLFVPVHRAAFVGSFGVVFMAGLAGEVLLVHRRAA